MKSLKELYSTILLEKKKKDNFKTPGTKSKGNVFGEEEKTSWSTGDTDYAKDYPLSLEDAEKKLKKASKEKLDSTFQELFLLMTDPTEKWKFRNIYSKIRNEKGGYEVPKNEKFDLIKK